MLPPSDLVASISLSYEQGANNRLRDYFMVLVDSQDGFTGEYQRVGLMEVWFQIHEMRDM